MILSGFIHVTDLKVEKIYTLVLFAGNSNLKSQKNFVKAKNQNNTLKLNKQMGI